MTTFCSPCALSFGDFYPTRLCFHVSRWIIKVYLILALLLLFNYSRCFQLYEIRSHFRIHVIIELSTAIHLNWFLRSASCYVRHRVAGYSRGHRVAGYSRGHNPVLHSARHQENKARFCVRQQRSGCGQSFVVCVALDSTLDSGPGFYATPDI